jgi:hypothetical protein
MAAGSQYTEREGDAYAEELLPHFSDIICIAGICHRTFTDRISNEIRTEPEFVRRAGLLQEFCEPWPENPD